MDHDVLSKQTVLVLGATGATGSSIVNGMLAASAEKKKFHVVAGVRPASLDKPEIQVLQERGVEIRHVDVAADDVLKLVTAFRGVDTLICAFSSTEVKSQYKIADAAKLAGVRRFVPNDWGPACVRGRRKLFDEKGEVHDYIKSIGLGYTFIDVGYWMTLLLPVEPERSEYKGPGADTLPCNSHTIYGTGDVKTAVIDLDDIGKFVAEIISDERTLNQYVFCRGDEKSQNEMFAIAQKARAESGISGEMSISPKKIYTEEALVQDMEHGDPMVAVSLEYMYSAFVRGDNTVENTKKAEYGSALDARELYPKLKVTSLEEYAKQLYLQAL